MTMKNFFKRSKVESQCDYKKLKSQGMKVSNKKKFDRFIDKYGKTRVLDGYGSCFQSENGYYVNGISTNQLIKFVKFDQTVGKYILSYLLDLEQTFNRNLIKHVMKEYNLKDDYVLDPNNSDWLIFKSLDERSNFFNNIYQNADSSNFLKKFDDKKNIPLISLSLSWTFFNIIVLFESVNMDVQNKVIDSLGLSGTSIDIFKSMIHIIRRLRNTISHNDFLMDSKFEIYKSLIKKENLNENKNYFYIYDICELLDKVYPSRKGVVPTLLKLIKKQRFASVVSLKVYELLGIKEEVYSKEKNKKQSK